MTAATTTSPVIKSKFQSIILAFRPKTLTASLVPCLAATALAATSTSTADMKFQWWIFVYALIASFFIQIGTNLVNDAMDFKKGADTSERIGPQRITQAGVLTSMQVLGLATLFFIGAVLLGIPLVNEGGQPIIIIGILSVMMGYGYTAGPYPLAYRGLGDLFVILFFGLAAVMGLFFLHTKMWTMDSFLLGLQIGLHATVLIAINNLRDIDGDAKVNKRTLAVRLGIQGAKKEIYFLCLAPFVLQIYWALQGRWVAAVLPLIALPLAIKIMKNVKNTAPSSQYNQFLGQSAGLHLLFGVLLSIGFIL
ncbi:MAG: 1,4-dihydroxy-2-naphthoate octaprenyltransferase [Bdellovibrionaceae bacterium]|nr:1,4-dihydroxy-2-naphthoate octaprenyltransferase [Pseudobdellovibrionaceae bacterium]